MIEILEAFPQDVVAVSAKGRITRRDYEDVLIPKLRAVLACHEGVRCYYELGPEFSGMDAGAAWEDFKVGIEYLFRWKRVAVVTDLDWIRNAVTVMRFMVPGEVRVFGTRQAAEARKWVSAE